MRVFQGGSIFKAWGWLTKVKDDVLILYYAWKNPKTPAYIRGLLVLMAAYVISPIDIVPDYLPFLGIVDDLTVIPVGILSLTQLLPKQVRLESERESQKWRKRIPFIVGLLGIIGLAWIVMAIVGIGYLLQK